MMRSERVLTRVGNNVKIQNRSKSQDQIFVFDPKTQSIQPKKDTSMAISIGDKGKGRNLTVEKGADLWSQHFNLKGDQVVNERGLVFDVAGGKDRHNQNVLVWKSHNGINQKWKVEYV